MSNRLSVAIVGAGIGALHLDGFLELPGIFEVRTICDLDLDRARPLAAKAGCGCRDDLDSVMTDPGVDIVDICLPPHLHVPTASRALRAGKHVICEKPLAPSLAGADQLVALSRETGRRVFPVFQYRFGPATARLRALVDAGLAGRPFAAALETHWDRGPDYYATAWRGTWAGELGGAVLGHAIHAHDLLTAFMGPVKRVHAELATLVNPIETEDCAALTIRHASGAVSTSSITLGAATDTSRFRFVFEGLTAESATLPYAPAEGDWTFTARSPRSQSDIDAVVAGVPDSPAGYAGLFSAVSDTLAGSSGDDVTLLDARRSIEFATAVYASSRAGTPIDLPLPDDHPLANGWIPGGGAPSAAP